MQSLAVSGYTADAVQAALHAASREWRFRYDLLTSANVYEAALTSVLSSQIENNSLADIKRTARFTVRDDGNIDFLSERIKPYAQLKMPDDGWAEWPLGVFLLSTPPRAVDAAGVVTREIDAYDQLQVLQDDKVEDRYTVAAAINYITAVKTLLDGAGITGQNLTATSKTLPEVRVWPPGAAKLAIVNDLLGAVNYRSLYFDENGVAVAQPYVSPSDRPSEYTYQDDGDSVLIPEAQESLDLFAIANKWVLVKSEPDADALIATYTNTSVDSPTSTVNRGRTIVDFRERVEAADQDALNGLVARLAYEASQVYQQVEFATGIMPFHGDRDVYILVHSGLAVSAKFSEVSWSLPLVAGGAMKHTARRVVTV